MTYGIEPKPWNSHIYRVGRLPEPWSPPDWAYAGSDGTFGGRYDDPLGTYRVTYASSETLGAFVETLAGFRSDLAILAADIQNDPADADYPTIEPGTVPRDWIEKRALAVAVFHGIAADVAHTRSLEMLRRKLADRILVHQIPDLDASSIRLSAPRRFTQEVSRFVYEQVDSSGGRAFDGVFYRSRLGDQLENWALFEPVSLLDARGTPLQIDDPALTEALRTLGLKLDA